MDNQIVFTYNFTKLALAFNRAIVKKEIIGIVSPPGAGFKHALSRFCEKHYLKVVFCSVQYKQSIGHVILELFKDLCNIKFTNINCSQTNLHDLSRAINSRLRIGDSCLLCIDGCSNLTPSQLKYFVQFLKRFDKPIGLVFRMSETYVKKLERDSRFKEIHLNLVEVVDGWGVLEQPTPDEMKAIAYSMGIDNPMIIEDLLESSRNNLTILKKNIEHIKRFRASKS